MTIDKLYGGNVYVDGSNNLLGKIAEFTMPEIVATIDSHKALGQIGTIELPSGLEALTAKIKWDGFYGDSVMLGSNPYASHKLQIRASVERHSPEGLVAEAPLTVHMVARWKKNPLGAIAPQSSTMSEQELSLTYLKVVLEGRELLEIDMIANIHKVDGKDVRLAYRANLGL